MNSLSYFIPSYRLQSCLFWGENVSFNFIQHSKGNYLSLGANKYIIKTSIRYGINWYQTNAVFSRSNKNISKTWNYIPSCHFVFKFPFSDFGWTPEVEEFPPLLPFFRHISTTRDTNVPLQRDVSWTSRKRPWTAQPKPVDTWWGRLNKKLAAKHAAHIMNLFKLRWPFNQPCSRANDVCCL